MLVPFLDKAFTIDDPIFLMEARHSLSDPLHPTAFDMVWGDVPSRVSVMSGPLMGWLLVPSVMAGGAERIGHGVVIAAVAVLLYATVALAMRLGIPARASMLAALLLAATPALLGMAGTVMPDVPAAALGTLGLERLVAWKQERRVHQAVLSAVLLGSAPLARSHTILLIPIGALLLVGDFRTLASWRTTRWTAWLPLVAAPILMGMGLVVIRDPDARAAVIGPTQLSSSASIVPNVIAFLAHWSLTIPLALPWALLRPVEVFRRWGVLLVSTLAAGAAIVLTGRGSVVLAPILAISVTVLWDVLADGLKRRDPLQLTLGLWLFVPLAPAPYPHLPAKYLLAAAPAAAILVAREMEERTAARSRLTLGLTMALGLALGIAILRADAAFGDVGRRAARELVAPNVAAGHRVWFAGHWGFHWYAERAGARSLTVTPPFPATGDLVVEPLNTDVSFRMRRLLRMTYPRITVLGSVEDRRPGGRVMCKQQGAGFFSNEWGYLPWAWDDDILDSFVLYRID